MSGVAAYRGREFAAAAVAGWAAVPPLGGRSLFYGPARTNVSSQRAVRRQGLRFVGASVAVTGENLPAAPPGNASNDSYPANWDRAIGDVLLRVFLQEHRGSRRWPHQVLALRLTPNPTTPRDA